MNEVEQSLSVFRVNNENKKLRSSLNSIGKLIDKIMKLKKIEDIKNQLQKIKLECGTFLMKL